MARAFLGHVRLRGRGGTPCQFAHPQAHVAEEGDEGWAGDASACTLRQASRNMIRCPCHPRASHWRNRCDSSVGSSTTYLWAASTRIQADPAEMCRSLRASRRPVAPVRTRSRWKGRAATCSPGALGEKGTDGTRFVEYKECVDDREEDGFGASSMSVVGLSRTPRAHTGRGLSRPPNVSALRPRQTMTASFCTTSIGAAA